MNRDLITRGSLIAMVLLAGLQLQACDRSTSYDESIRPVSVRAADGEKIKLPDSAIYDGDYRDGLFHGDGTLVWRNGEVYKGEFANGMLHGEGVYEFASGERYEGELANGMLEGTGRLESVQGDIYQGEFKAGYFHGQGRFEQVNGDIYEGDFLKGQFTGKGKIIYSDSGKYEGDVRNWEMHGQGSYISMHNGTVYSGTFVNNVLSGQGKIVEKSGDQYEGNIANWTGDGQGELKRKNGEHYKGGFKSGVYHGEGKITYKNKSTYEGHFEHGLRHGMGTLVRAEPKGHKKVVKGWWQYNNYVGDKKPTENAAKKTRKKPTIDAEGIFYRQPDMLAEELNKLKTTTLAVPDVYMINFASYSSQDVFMKEAQFARELFSDKFAARDRTINLINNHKVVKKIPLASVTNLQRSIDHVANVMDKDEDILFLFLTTHGSKKKLSVSMKGMPLNDLSAEKLSSILKKSGIKWKVIVISACYSGSFIEDLKDDHTMVLTASKADHVSFGCSDEADFTFFGRAFFKNALKDAPSFKQAFEQARVYVSQWEDEEKYDHSEPQIWTTAQIENQLALWRKAIQATANTPP